MEQIYIGFDTSDPEQAIALSILRSTKRGSKGKAVSGSIIHMLSSHGIQPTASDPKITAQFLDLVLKLPHSPTPVPAASPVAPVATATGEKKKKSKPEKKTVSTPKPVNIPASAPEIKEEKKEETKNTPLPSPTPATTSPADTPSGDDKDWLDPRYPWRLPNRMMKIIQTQADMDTMGFDPETMMEQYALDIDDFSRRHPEAAPPPPGQ